MPTMIKLTRYSTLESAEGLTDRLSDIYVSVDKIVSLDVQEYYRGFNHGKDEVVDKVYVNLGGEDGFHVNETIEQVLAAIPAE